MSATVTPAARLAWVSALLVLLAGAGASAQAADVKLQGFLLWGTDEAKPPADKKYQPVDAEVRKKLKALPLKWTNWFEVKRVEFPVPQSAVKEVAMSEKCQVKVQQVAGAELEVAVIGKGKEVMKRRQALPKGEMLVLGGNAPNSTCWLVVLKRIE
jgi:hypothetical protein